MSLIISHFPISGIFKCEKSTSQNKWNKYKSKHKNWNYMLWNTVSNLKKKMYFLPLNGKLWEVSINKKDKYRTTLVGNKWAEVSMTGVRFTLTSSTLRYLKYLHRTDLKIAAFEKNINFQRYEEMLHKNGCIFHPYY